ncbi:hypothetical protein DL96DRAFT_1527687 [Flagelloscypha sp. PMI_526]|nr:hypothetical protein DL96DRAFT_1527687 [Flagelloscypha sp. PMI_526]
MGTTSISTQISTRILILFSLFLAFAQALPVDVLLSRELVTRERAILRNETGDPRVFKPDTGDLVLQGPASDGAGFGFDAPAVIWLIFTGVIGLGLSLAGIRGWRFTTGSGVGLALAVCSYAAIVNTVDEVGISDILLTIIVLAFFTIGFILGLFKFAKFGGIALLGITGGLAIGMRAVLSLEGLMFSSDDLYVVNWAVVAVLGLIGGILILWKQRLGILIGCTSCGTFLLAIALDLVISKQEGVSRGLRFLIDRNPSHFVDIFKNGYHPTLTTRIIIWASLGLIPALAFAQHKIFKQPFDRTPEVDDSELQINYPDEKEPAPRPLTHGFLANLWEGARNNSPNRFSLDSLKMLTKSQRARGPM